MLRMRKETILYVQPCASERGKLMADIELSPDLDAEFFDGRVLCALLEIHHPGFAELKCSPSLGVAKFMWKGREISVFRNGKLKVQRCLDRADIMKTAGRVARLVWGAALCKLCGRPALECAAGRCGVCLESKRTTKAEDIPAGEVLKHALELRDSGDRRRAGYFALHFVVETPGKGDAAAGLSLLDEILREV